MMDTTPLTSNRDDDRAPCGRRGRATGPVCPRLALVLLPLVLLAHLAHPPSIRADGCFFSSYGRDIVEPAQKALILYDEETQTEDLIIQPSFETFTRDFAWVVPVPSMPALAIAEDVLFLECSRLTRPEVRGRKGSGGCSSVRSMQAPPPDSGGVSVYDERLVGIYQTMTIGASDAGVLSDSLDAWGYLHPHNRDRIEEALGFYIDRSWVFVAMKVDSDRFWDRGNETVPWRGSINPIRLTFAAEEIVYPMRLSVISAAEQTHVLLYVCAGHRMTYAGAMTEYAHRVNAAELPSIRAQYPNLGALLEGPCFITKLRRTLGPEEMTGDIVLSRAAGDDEYREVIYYDDVSPMSGLLTLTVAGVFAWRWRRMWRRRPART